MLERRFELETKPQFPEEVQVTCPKVDCVGLGYLGFDTVMCFLCEHQWLATKDQGLHGHSIACWEELPETVKPCPRCGTLIEKDGVCDHLACQCGYEFVWPTLEMYEPEPPEKLFGRGETVGPEDGVMTPTRCVLYTSCN
jgi:hypothetical protein